MGVADQRCIKVSPIKLIMQYRFAPPKTLKTCRVPELLRNRSFVQTVYSDPPFPSWRMILDRSSPSRVRSAAFRALDRSGPIRRGWLFTRREKGVMVSGRVRAERFLSAISGVGCGKGRNDTLSVEGPLFVVPRVLRCVLTTRLFTAEIHENP